MIHHHTRVLVTELSGIADRLVQAVRKQDSAEAAVAVSRRGYLDTLLVQAGSEPLGSGSALTLLVNETMHLAQSMAGASDISPALSQPLRNLRQILARLNQGLAASPRRAGVKIGRAVEKQLLVMDELSSRELALPVVINDLKRTLRACLPVADGLIQLDLGDAASLNNQRQIRRLSKSMNLDSLSVQRLALTRSGSVIGAITSDGHPHAVYKEGSPRKLGEEVEGVSRWAQVVPKLVPEVLSQDSDDSLLIQHLPGQTLESLLLDASDHTLDGFQVSMRKLRTVWKKTATQVVQNPKFMSQTRDRLAPCQRLHPNLFKGQHTLAGLARPGLLDLIDAVALRERHWSNPGSTLIHGDLNLDNVLFEPTERSVFFIDLHRSAFGDYVQDISTLLVSIARLRPGQNPSTETRITVAQLIYESARRYAKQSGDTGFDARLACGIARGLITSTRFIADQKQAKPMLHCAGFLLEQLSQLSNKQIARYKAPIKEIYVSTS